MSAIMPIPGRIFDRLEEIRKRSGAKPQDVEIEQVRSLLPNWSDSVRRVPNVALRSALFGAISKGHRPYLERVKINALGGISILYTGALLDQGDLDVWETVLHLARMQELGSECRVTAYRLLKDLGRTDTGKNRTILDRHLSRMKATALQVRVGEHSYEGSLIHEVYRDHDSRSYVIRLNPKLRVLFLDDQFTDVDWSVRQALHGRPLAQWLHGFYVTHARPYNLKVETLHRLCGSRASSLRDFKKDLRRSLDTVERASNAAGQPFSYLIEGNLVRVKTTPSPSQRRHLANKR
ncbi:plasmid replication initiator TrfA [Pseudomonas farris]